MGTFKSSRYFPISVPDLAPVAEEVIRDFRGRGFEVTGERSLTGGWLISLHKGGTFKAVVGMKTALNVTIEPAPGGTQVNAGIGIFGQQVIPTLISAMVFWPVLLAQIAGMVQNAKLDDLALEVVESALIRHSGRPVAVPVGTLVDPRAAPAPSAPVGRFCTECGTSLGESAKFCVECGARVETAV